MSTLSRVVWSEGMHLAQHHFQAQSRYFEELTTFALRGLAFEPWGVAACELDAEALLNGTVSVTHAAGIMPDGLTFSFPEEPPPPALPIRDAFSPTQDAEIVYLAVPAYRPGAANAGPGGRFASTTVDVPDEVTGNDPRPVGIARGNYRLLLEGSTREDLVVLPLARIRRDGSGHFVYDESYVPPCLRIGASTRLLTMLARLVEVLDARAETLRAERAAAAPGAGAGQASREIASFWLSHALHSSIPTLRGLLESRACHPEQLYTELARLAGALCTFALASNPRSLPLYDHNELGGCFGALEQHILAHLEVVLPTTSLTVPARRVQDFYYSAVVTDGRAYQKARWLLGARSSVGPAELAERLPRLVKLCSSVHIARLVRDAYPGLTLQPVMTPPAAISPRFDTQYFSIQLTGPCWTSIRDTHEVGIYVPAAVPDAELEVCILFES